MEVNDELLLFVLLFVSTEILTVNCGDKEEPEEATCACVCASDNVSNFSLELELDVVGVCDSGRSCLNEIDRLLFDVVSRILFFLRGTCDMLKSGEDCLRLRFVDIFLVGRMLSEKALAYGVL